MYICSACVRTPILSGPIGSSKPSKMGLYIYILYNNIAFRYNRHNWTKYVTRISMLITIPNYRFRNVMKTMSEEQNRFHETLRVF